MFSQTQDSVRQSLVVSHALLPVLVRVLCVHAPLRPCVFVLHFFLNLSGYRCMLWTESLVSPSPASVTFSLRT